MQKVSSAVAGTTQVVIMTIFVSPVDTKFIKLALR